MDYFVKDGEFIVANTARGCWGPMNTRALKGGHGVTKSVFVEGAEVGDAIAIHIKNVDVTSTVTGSGNDEPVIGRFTDDTFVDAKCPECGIVNPETVMKGIGEKTVHCSNGDTDITLFVFTHAYSMTFNDKKV